MSWMILLPGLVAIYLVLRTIYRLFFHPLAKFPGPKLAAVSYLYEFYQDVFAKEGGDFINQCDDLHDKYGPIVRVTPDEVHIRDPDWSRDVLYTSDKDHVRDKDPSLALSAGTSEGTFGTVKHEIHRRRRAPVNTYFSKTKVYEMQDKLWDRSECLAGVLRRHHQQKSVANGRALFLGWSNDTLRSYAFGHHLELTENPERAKQFDEVFSAFGVLYPYLRHIGWLIPYFLVLPTAPFWYVWRPLAILLSIHKECRKQAASTVATYNDSNLPKWHESPRKHDGGETLYKALIASNMPAVEKLPDRLANEGFEILLAGSDTTARAMGLSVFHILANPSAKDRLVEELNTALPSGSNGRVDLRVLENLPWLTACLTEALRIGKTTDHRFSLICPKEDLKYGEWTIPAGCRISTTPNRNSFDKDYFPDPYAFCPERWLQDEETVAKMERIYMPFMVGRRNCLGQFFARAELRIGLARVFHDFDLQLHDTIRERDIDHTWSHIAGEPSRGGKGLRLKVVDAL